MSLLLINTQLICYFKPADVSVEISTTTKMLTPLQLEKEYHDWILQMHNRYDEEADAGEDKPVILVNPPNKKALGISNDGMTNKILMAIASSYVFLVAVRTIAF